MKDQSKNEILQNNNKIEGGCYVINILNINY